MSPFMRRPVRHMWTIIQVDRRGGDEGERTVEPFLVQRVEEQIAADGADRDGDADAPVDGRGQRRASRLAQVRQADGDDQESFEALSKGDDKRLQHDGADSR